MKMKHTQTLKSLTAGLVAAAALLSTPALHGAVTISTTNGLGADTYLSNDSQTGEGPGSVHGLAQSFNHRVYAGTRMKLLYVRFDKGNNLINYAGSTITLNFGGAGRTRTCTVFGLKDGDIGEAWGESTVCYSNAPGIAWTNGTPLAQFPTINSNRMVALGTMPNFESPTGDQTSSASSLDLQSFLESDTDGLVTLLFLTTSDSSQTYWGRTKETTNTLGELMHLEPRLNMPNAVVDPGLSNLTWAAASGVWNFAANNWNNGSANVAYQEVSGIGNRIQLDDSASGSSPITISLDTAVVPRSITNDSTKSYVITGAGSGAINGGAGITKLGSGTLTLSNVVNGFVGPVRIYGGTLAFSSSALGAATASILIDGGTLKFVSGNSEDISSHLVTFGASGATIDTSDNSVSLAAVIGGTGTGGLTKVGPGYLGLAPVAHNYTGPTIVSGGTLALTGGSLASTNIVINSGATLDVNSLGALTLDTARNQQLSGNGTNSGGLTVAAGTSLLPGTSAGTLTITGDLTMNGGTNVFDISTDPLATDRLVVQSSVYVNSGRVRLVPATTLTNGSYLLIQYAGSLVGSASTMLIDGFSQAGQVAILDDSTPGQIRLIVATASSDSLVWTGDGGANLWNVAGAANWNNGGGADVFNHGDAVTFNSVGAANNQANLALAVIPGSVTVDAATDYIFNDSTGVGGGKISGATGLTKNNTGKLTILTVNNNSGTTTINGGTVEVGNGAVDGSLGSGSVVNNGNLVFNQTASRTVPSITGTGSLSQLGANTLTVPGNTSYNGTTTIGSGATLVLGNGGALTLTTAGVTDDGTLVLNTSAGQTLSTPFTGAGNFTKRGTGALAINAAPGYTGVTAIEGGTTTFGAANVVTGGLRVETGATVNLNGFNQTVASLASTVFAGGTLVNNGTSVTNTVTVDNASDTDSSIAINNGASGVIALKKKGAGTLLLRGNSTYSGGTIVEAGTLDYRADAALGTGLLILSNSTAFTMGGNGVYPGVNMLVAAGATVNMNSAALGNGFGGNISSGDNLGVLNIVGPVSFGTAAVKQFQPFTGKVLVDAAGTLRFSATALSANGGDNATFEVNGTLQTRNGTGVTADSGVSLGALTGTGSIGGPQAPPGNSTYILGLSGASATFNGTIYGDVVGSANTIVKAGAGTQTLAGLNLYVGSTIVSNGVLAFAGVDSNPTNTVAINVTAPGNLNVTGLPGGALLLGPTANNQVLSGNGTITGAVAVDSSGGNVVSVNPGNGIGTLTVSGGLTLASSSVVTMELNRSATQTSDRINATVTPNGATLIVTNIGGTLITDSTFQLFSGGVTGFGSVSLPATDATGLITYTWQNNIATTGSIKLLSGMSAASAPITSAISGGGATLDLSWPADHRGWTLQCQTNTLNVGITSTWYGVPGSTTNIAHTVPIVPGNPTVFYRLTLPLP
jgi:fibronectin-binding autotransporter adhesin